MSDPREALRSRIHALRAQRAQRKDEILNKEVEEQVPPVVNESAADKEEKEEPAVPVSEPSNVDIPPPRDRNSSTTTNKSADSSGRKRTPSLVDQYASVRTYSVANPLFGKTLSRSAESSPQQKESRTVSDATDHATPSPVAAAPVDISGASANEERETADSRRAKARAAVAARAAERRIAVGQAFDELFAIRPEVAASTSQSVSRPDDVNQQKQQESGADDTHDVSTDSVTAQAEQLSPSAAVPGRPPPAPPKPRPPPLEIPFANYPVNEHSVKSSPSPRAAPVQLSPRFVLGASTVSDDMDSSEPEMSPRQPAPAPPPAATATAGIPTKVLSQQRQKTAALVQQEKQLLQLDRQLAARETEVTKREQEQKKMQKKLIQQHKDQQAQIRAQTEALAREQQRLADKAKHLQQQQQQQQLLQEQLEQKLHQRDRKSVV